MKAAVYKCAAHALTRCTEFLRYCSVFFGKTCRALFCDRDEHSPLIKGLGTRHEAPVIYLCSRPRKTTPEGGIKRGKPHSTVTYTSAFITARASLPFDISFDFKKFLRAAPRSISARVRPLGKSVKRPAHQNFLQTILSTTPV